MPPSYNQYDYIIAGAGAAGLSLAWKILQSPLDKKILVVDNTLEPVNDKTWCFWHNGSPPFADIVYNEWNQGEIGVGGRREVQSLNAYAYYCIRKGDFQRKILPALHANSNFNLTEEKIGSLKSEKNHATLHTADNTYHADYIFQSCFQPRLNKYESPKYSLLQHFGGWEIKTGSPSFDAETFTLMDFDEINKEEISFIYILPWSSESALIEYTVFSDHPFKKNKYEEKLSLYLNSRFDLRPIDYNINRREFGKIPMQDQPNKSWFSNRILNIGTVGGLTKPSTGYTFKRIQEHTDAIIEELISNGRPTGQNISKFRYMAYDLWLLQIMHDHPRRAHRIFDSLFNNNSMDTVFRFLGEDTTLKQDLKIMNSVPYSPFLKAIWKTRGRLRQLYKSQEW